MGVYIKGMEMPDGCVVCPFFIENRHDRGDDSLCRASRKEVKCGCPLVPVPPHGDLIDRDALIKGEGRYIISFGKEGIDIAEINRAPTIIEAEEET